MDMSIANIARIVSLLLAVVFAFVAFDYAALLLVIAGLLVGLVAVPEERRLNIMVMAIALAMMTDALAPIPAVGQHITNILGNMSSVFNASVIAVILTVIYERVTAKG